MLKTDNYIPLCLLHAGPKKKAIRANLTEAQKVAAGNGSEADKAEAEVEVSVYEALQHALSK